ncbi:MAG: preprotein translocase subunit YajC [Actinomycetota bacterium]|nr:preprotein translocase subunit YajC [Actinomycetota bacterium]
MTFLLHPLLLQATTTTAPGKAKSSGSSLFTIVFLVLIVAVGYFLIIRPRQARMKQQKAQVSTLEIGSEVMSVGGIMGTIVGITDTTFDVEVADGIVMTFVKRAINPRPASAGEPTPVDDADGDLPPDPWDEEPEHDDSSRPSAHGEDPGSHEHEKGDDAGHGEHGRQGGDGHRGPDGETGTGSGGLGSGGH